MMMIDGRRSNLFIYAREQVANLVNSRKKGGKKKKGEMWNLLMGERKFRWEA